MLIKKLQVKDIGEVDFIQSSSARHVRISVQAFSAVRVTVPKGCNYSIAEKFLLEKTDWLKKVLLKQKKAESGLTSFDLSTEFKTLEHQLLLNPEERKNINISVRNSLIKISYPKNVDPKHELIQSCIRKGIEEAWRIEASRHLPLRLQELAEKFGFSYNNVSVRNSKTRWGSCSPENNIALSIHLIRVPQHLIDYVILHELVHTIHKNHSERYHQALQKIMPEEKTYSRELRKYHINVY